MVINARCAEKILENINKHNMETENFDCYFGDPFNDFLENLPDLQIKFIKTHPDAILPKKNHPDPFTGDAGYDLFAVETTTIPARGSNIVPVGMKLGYITPGYWFRIEARSGNGFKKSLAPHFGIIDCGYRGDLGVKLYNFSDIDQVIEKGAGAAQIIPYRMYRSTVDWIEEGMAEQSERGEKGFGSSDE